MFSVGDTAPFMLSEAILMLDLSRFFLGAVSDGCEFCRSWLSHGVGGRLLPPGVEGTDWVVLSLGLSQGGVPAGPSFILVVCGSILLLRGVRMRGRGWVHRFIYVSAA